MTERALRISFIAINRNYGRFLREAIDSLLAVRWPDKEVIVVDDGSTDESRAVIASYGDRIIPLYKEHGGQNSGANVGYARSSGDVVYFLDTDDVLFPEAAEVAMASYRPGVAKIQFPLYHIDTHGNRLGTQHPRFTERHTHQWFVESLRRTGFYDGSPTSGNFWSRDFLNIVFPLPTNEANPARLWGFSFDAYFLLLAPFFGELVSLPTPLALYRIHGHNHSNVGRFNLELQAAKCEEEIDRDKVANEMLLAHGKIASLAEGINSDLCHMHMKRRMMYNRLLPEKYPYGDSITSLFIKHTLSILRADLSLKSKGLLLTWGGVMWLAPRPVAYWAARVKEEEFRRNWRASKINLVAAPPVVE